MATTFAHLSITVSIGSDATQDTGAVAELIRGAADRIEVRDWSDLANTALRIVDANGNTVGMVDVTGYSIEED